MVSDGQFPLMEDFYSLQGEGQYQGYAAYFIRLAGCDVGCVWCDVKESWPVSNFPKVSAADLVRKVLDAGADRVVVTGGEPTQYNLEPLSLALKKENLKLHLETSGAYEITGQWDWICLSPKKFKAPLDSSLEKAHELKVVIYHKSDFDWAEEMAARTSSSCSLFLQPEWSKEKVMNPLILDYIKKNTQWKLSLQIHKYLNIP